MGHPFPRGAGARVWVTDHLLRGVPLVVITGIHRLGAACTPRTSPVAALYDITRHARATLLEGITAALHLGGRRTAHSRQRADTADGATGAALADDPVVLPAVILDQGDRVPASNTAPLSGPLGPSRAAARTQGRGGDPPASCRYQPFPAHPSAGAGRSFAGMPAGRSARVWSAGPGPPSPGRPATSSSGVRRRPARPAPAAGHVPRR
ncbi:hypothetical protein GCM10027168_11910 [Streptomyces capparidis]